MLFASNTLNTDRDFFVKTFFRQLESKHGVICYLSGKHGHLYLYLFCFFAWLLQPKATHCCILTVRSNHDTPSARSALRAIQDGRPGNFKRAIGPIFGSR